MTNDSPLLNLLELALLERDLSAVRGLVRRRLRADGRTLELGCGPGLFADLFSAGDYVGVEPRPRFVDYARRHRPGAFICDPLAGIGIADARFDQVLGLDLLGATTDGAGRAIAAEIKRLLAPPGRALFVERAEHGKHVERLASSVGRIEQRDFLGSGFRERVAILVTTGAAGRGLP